MLRFFQNFLIKECSSRIYESFILPAMTRQNDDLPAATSLKRQKYFLCDYKIRESFDRRATGWRRCCLISGIFLKAHPSSKIYESSILPAIWQAARPVSTFLKFNFSEDSITFPIILNAVRVYCDAGKEGLVLPSLEFLKEEHLPTL